MCALRPRRADLTREQMRLNRESARMEAVQCSVVGEREDLRAQVSHRGAGG